MTSQLDVSELQQIAIRQQQQIESQQRELRLKEERAAQLRLAGERQQPGNQKRLSLHSRVAHQEERLRRLRHQRDQVQPLRMTNATLGESLELN